MSGLDPPVRVTPLDFERLPVGPELAKLRRQRGLTGQQLGDLVGMSQAKVSKIEVGSSVPSLQDVELIARALGASDDRVTALLERAAGAHDELIDLHATSRRITAAQRQLAGFENNARVTRVFQPAVVPGLLQTTEYARAVLTDYAELYADAVGGPGTSDEQVVPPAITARIARQEVLYNRKKKFFFLMMETVLLNRVCGPGAMLAQLDRIRDVSAYPNVMIGIVSTSTQLAYPPLHGFQLLDEKNVVIDLANTAVVSPGVQVLRIYRQVFEYFFEQASTDIGPILDRYSGVYASQAGPG